MIEVKNPKIAVPVVLFAGILWSFGALIVRYMQDPHLVPWQYIFSRGLTIFIILKVLQLGLENQSSLQKLKENKK